MRAEIDNVERWVTAKITIDVIAALLPWAPCLARKRELKIVPESHMDGAGGMYWRAAHPGIAGQIWIADDLDWVNVIGLTAHELCHALCAEHMGQINPNDDHHGSVCFSAARQMIGGALQIPALDRMVSDKGWPVYVLLQRDDWPIVNAIIEQVQKACDRARSNQKELVDV